MICAKFYVLMLHAVVWLFFFSPASRQIKWWLQDCAGAKSCTGVRRSTGLTDCLKQVKAGTRQVFSSYLLCSCLGVPPWETGRDN